MVSRNVAGTMWQHQDLVGHLEGGFGSVRYARALSSTHDRPARVAWVPSRARWAG
jgi:hypothetical protein